MKRLFTITGNLLAESRARFVSPKAGETVRAIGGSEFQVGGKGVNVSRAAAFLGMETSAVIFPAGHNGRRCLDSLLNENFRDIIPVEIEGETREGLVCVDSVSGVETTYLGSDVPVREIEFETALAEISKRAHIGDIVALCGSFPNWKKSFAEKLVSMVSDKNLSLCADTYALPLADIFKIDTDILKINRKEIFSLLGRKDDGTFESFIDAFEYAASQTRAKFFAVSDGGNCALAKESNFDTKKYFPPKIEREVSATGCGDLLFAALIYQISELSVDYATAFGRAIELASLSAESPNIIGVSKRDAKKILKI